MGLHVSLEGILLQVIVFSCQLSCNNHENDFLLGQRQKRKTDQAADRDNKAGDATPPHALSVTRHPSGSVMNSGLLIQAAMIID